MWATCTQNQVFKISGAEVQIGGKEVKWHSGTQCNAMPLLAVVAGAGGHGEAGGRGESTDDRIEKIK